jgi:hypothetical protein
MLGVAEEAVRLQRFKPGDEFLRKDVAALAELQFDEFWWPDNLDIPVPGESLRQVPRGKAVLGFCSRKCTLRGASLISSGATIRLRPLRGARRHLIRAYVRHAVFQVLAPSRPGTFCKPRSRLQRL